MPEKETSQETLKKIIDKPRCVLSILQHLLKTFGYWTDILATIRYFQATRDNKLSRAPQTWFHLGKIPFCVRPIDWYAMESIFLDKEYKPLKAFFADASPKVIVDAGANIGLFSVFAFATWDSPKIYAIEASKETFSVLKKNKERNPNHDWQLYQSALWKKDGEISFASDGLSLGWHVSETLTEERVPAIRLDSFIEKHLLENERISLLKLDIEGAEEAVLQASSPILERVDALFIEIHPDMCDEAEVMMVLKNNFPYLYDLSEPDGHYPLILAVRKEFAGYPLRV